MNGPGVVILRAHNVLCLQGFRGEGYSPGFVARMTAVHRTLAHDAEVRVRLVAAPDDLCTACPHLRDGCTLGGPEHEAHMRTQDLEVLARLGLREGATEPWRVVRARIGERVEGRDLPAICTTCPWLPLGWCAQGVDHLRTGPPR